MITPSTVFRYFVAATAAFSITAPVVDFLMSIAWMLATIAFLSFVLAILSVILWVDTGDSWGLIYLGICCAVFAASMGPLTLGAWLIIRWSKKQQTAVRLPD